jgi:hypothetical protein
MTALGVAVRFATGPVGLIIIAIGLLVAGLIYAYKHSEVFRTIVNAVFGAVRDFVSGAITAIVGFVKGAIDWIKANFPLIVGYITAPFRIVVSALGTAWGAIKTAAQAAFRFVVDKFLGLVESVLKGAAKAFGWVPGLGDKLKGAAAAFGVFRDEVNAKLGGLQDQKISVTAELKSYGTPEMLAAAHGRGMATGGKVFGPGGPTDDLVPAMLSPTEWVINSKASRGYGDDAMASVNAGTATIVPHWRKSVRSKLHQLHTAHTAHLTHVAHVNHQNHDGADDDGPRWLSRGVPNRSGSKSSRWFGRGTVVSERGKLHELHAAHLAHLAHLTHLTHANGRDTELLAIGMAGGGRAGVVLSEHLPSQRAQRLFAGDVASTAVAAVRPLAQKAANAAAAQNGPAGPPGSVVNYRGVRLNQRTIKMLLAAERILGKTFHITQGSYSTSVAASGGTHAGGGAMDTNGPGGWNTAVAALRRVGFAAWHRLPSQGPWGEHIHSIALGDPTASRAAKNQMAAFRRGGDGLGHGMALGGKVGTRQALAAMGIRTFDSGGPWKSGTFGYNGSGKTETVIPGGGVMTVALSPVDRKLLRSVRDRAITLDGRRVDEGFGRRALGGGY